MKRRNRLITLLSLVFVLSMALSLALTAFGAVAETLNPTLFKMKEGASIRVSEPTGLRFIAEVDAQTVAAVEGDANSCFGALIVPSD